MSWLQKCQERYCNSKDHPLLDWDGPANGCRCRPNPCADVKTCPDHFPYLIFAYDNAGELDCSCSNRPQYASVYVSKNLCPGSYCWTESFPILDYEQETRQCKCMPHPCAHQRCTEPEFPLYEVQFDKDGAPNCSCTHKGTYLDRRSEL